MPYRQKEELLMSIKVKTPSGNVPLHKAPNMEWANRSLVSSNQQKLFETVLKNAQPSSQEANSLKQELNSLQTAQADSQKIDKTRATSYSQSSSQATANPLATSTLLKLSALSSRGDNLNSYSGNIASSVAARGRSPESLYVPKPTPPVPESSGAKELGNLSARFESGESGIDVIGYDENGGTSYGTYQIASRTGTMKRFVNYLEEHAPQWASRLKKAGPSDTGSRRGAVPREWQKIAAEDPDRFGRLQHDFIEETHYQPALQEIREKTGLDVEKQSKALQEVLWSTAVQHGPKGASNIFCKAINQGANSQSKYTYAAQSGGEAQGHDLIESVYASRSRQFGSSTSRVRSSVQRRFEEEKNIALNMLSKEGRGITARA